MQNNKTARRRGTSVAAAALSFALVAPFAQPVAEAAPKKADAASPAEAAAEPEIEGVQEENELPADVEDGDLEDPKPSDDPNEGLGEAIESPRPADVPTQRGGIEVVWADALDNGYIRTATGMTNAKSALSGRAFEFTGRGNVRPTGNGQRAVPVETTVYMQWIDEDGAVSPIYATKTREPKGTSAGQAGPGNYAFDLREPWYDANGKEHIYEAKSGQWYRLWIDDYEREGVRYTSMAQKNGFFPGSYVNSVTDRNNGAFPLIGTNMQRTAVFMEAQPEDRLEAMTLPRDQWKDATALRDDEGKPLGVETKIGRVNLATVANPTHDTINGSVWLETGAGEGGNFQTGPGRNYGSGDVPAVGYTVVLSQLSQSGYERYKNEVRTKPEHERNAYSLEWMRENGEDVIEATYYTTTDRDGNYSIQMPTRLPGTVKPLDNIWMTALDKDGNEVAAFSPWMLPQFHNATALGTRAANSYWPNHGGEGPISSATKRAHRNYSFAVIPEYRVNLDIQNFNVTDKPASLGQGQKAELKASGVVPALPTHIQWRVGDKIIKGGSETCPVTGVTDLKSCATLDIDAEYEVLDTSGKVITDRRGNSEKIKLQPGDVVRAVMLTGTQHMNEIASDSFVIRDEEETLDANEFDLQYKNDNTLTPGVETTIPAPTTPSGEAFPVDETDPKNPKPTRFAPALDPNFPVLDKNGKNTTFPGEYTVNPDGTITVTPAADAKPGTEYQLPVVVRYPDNSAETIYAQVKIVPNYDPTYAGNYTPTTTDEDKNKGQGTVAPAGETTKATPRYETTAPAGDVTATYEIADDFTAPKGYEATIDGNGVVSLKAADSTEAAPLEPVVVVPVEVSYSDGSATDKVDAVFYLDSDKDGTPDVDDPAPFDPNTPDPRHNTQFDPKFNEDDLKVKQGETKTVTPVDSNNKPLPGGTTYAPADKTPEWVSVGTDGTLTIAPTENVKPGKYPVTVEVTYPDGSKDTINTVITVDKADDRVTPISDNVIVPADGENHPVGTITKPTGEEKVTVRDKDGRPAKITPTVDPATGEITVKVPEGTQPGEYTVVVNDKDGKDGKKIGEIKFYVPGYGNAAKKVKPGEAENSVNPFGNRKPNLDKVTVNNKTGESEQAGWTFTPDQNTGVIKGKAPSANDLSQLFKNAFPEGVNDWDQFKKDFEQTGQPEAKATLDLTDGTSVTSAAKFELVGQDGKSIFDPNGDFDGDGVSNEQEIKDGTDPFDEKSNKTSVDASGKKPVTEGEGEQNTEVKVTFPKDKAPTVTATDEDGNTVWAEVHNNRLIVNPDEVTGKDGNPAKIDGPIDVVITDSEGKEHKVEIVVIGADGTEHTRGTDDNKDGHPKGQEETKDFFTPGQDGTNVPAGSEDFPLGTINDPKGGETTKVFVKDGNEVEGIKANIDEDGNVTVTVPEGTAPGEYVIEVYDQNGQKTGEIPFTVTGPVYDKDGVNVQPGQKATTNNPFEGQTIKPITGVTVNPTKANDWKFEANNTGAITGTAPTLDQLKDQFTKAFPEGKVTWEDFKKAFEETADPTVTATFTFETGKDQTGGTTFHLVDKDDKSLLDPKGDIDGDGVSNEQELKDGTNPFDSADYIEVNESSKKPVYVGKKESQDTGVTVTFPEGKKPEVSAVDEQNRKVAVELTSDGRLKVNPDDVKDKDGKAVNVDGPITVTVGGRKIEIDVIGKDGSKHSLNVDDSKIDTTDGEKQIDVAKCAASSVGFGLPLLALIPIGLATQMAIPGLTPVVNEVSFQLEQANANFQQQLGIFNPQMAGQVVEINAQLRQFGMDIATVGAGLVLIAAGILSGTLIYDACTPEDKGLSSKVTLEDAQLKGSSGKTYVKSSDNK